MENVEHPLRWPDGWQRTLISNRKNNGGWKKTFMQSIDALGKELKKLGVTSYAISCNPSPSDRTDPGVAIYWSAQMEADYSWQTALGLDTPAPTLAQIEDAFRNKAMQHHPDRGGNIALFQELTKHREQAKAWVLGTHKQDHEYSIACDKYTEPRLNVAALRLAITYLRGLERVGVPGIVERSFKGFKTALPAHASGGTNESSAA